jgi:hypothetical protein
MNHKQAIEEALTKLREIAAQRDALEAQMGKLHLAVRALCNLVDDKAEREAYKTVLERYRVRMGVSDLVRHCLHTFDAPMTPVEIRNFIVNYGSEASTQPNLLQSVHTILKRMAESGEATPDTNADGEKAYRRVSIGERLASIGVDSQQAIKIGDRFENMLMSDEFTQSLARAADATKNVGKATAEVSRAFARGPFGRHLAGPIKKDSK